MLTIYTARINYKAIGDELVLNTTIGSGTGIGKVFAPTWDLVNDIKKKRITWEEYTTRYLRLIRERYWKKREVFDAVVNHNEEVVLTCYCSERSIGGPKQCHRYILTELLLKIAKANGIAAKYGGER